VTSTWRRSDVSRNRVDAGPGDTLDDEFLRIVGASSEAGDAADRAESIKVERPRVFIVGVALCHDEDQPVRRGGDFDGAQRLAATDRQGDGHARHGENDGILDGDGRQFGRDARDCGECSALLAHGASRRVWMFGSR
jgi:hypothetical protein